MELPSSVEVLTAGDKTYYLLGTAHISEQSVADVKQVIAEVNPDLVCIELCKTRYDALTDQNRWQQLDIFKVIKEGKTLLLLANLALGAYQRRLGKELGIVPGAEMLAANDAARAMGIPVALVDRDIQVTLKRTWAGIPLRKKLLLLGLIFESLFSRQSVSTDDIEQLKQKATLSNVMEEFSRLMPEVKRSLIDERDQYMISSVQRAEGKRIVAVVGAAHVPGMSHHFGQAIDLDPLQQLPSKSRWVAGLKWLIPAIVLAAFTVGYFKHEGQTLTEMVYAWLLPNALMSSLFTAIAGGKIISIITSAIASPITSLNPLLGAGMVVGLMEAWLRKPTVADAQRINDDVQSVAGIYRNSFTRVLLVAIASTIGSALGAWIGMSWVLVLLS